MTIQNQIIQWFNEYDAMARKLYPTYAKRPVPSIKFIDKGRANGVAHLAKWAITFNTHIAAQANEAFRNTVSHEISHLIDYSIRLTSNHDAHWRMIHLALGGTGDRCSAYGATIKRARVMNTYLYRNANGAEIWVGPRHHNAILRAKVAGVRNSKGEIFMAADYTGQRKTLT